MRLRRYIHPSALKFLARKEKNPNGKVKFKRTFDKKRENLQLTSEDIRFSRNQIFEDKLHRDLMLSLALLKSWPTKWT